MNGKSFSFWILGGLGLAGAAQLPFPFALGFLPVLALGACLGWWPRLKSLLAGAALLSLLWHQGVAVLVNYPPPEDASRFLVQITSDPKPGRSQGWKSEGVVVKAGNDWRETESRWPVQVLSDEPLLRGGSYWLWGERKVRRLFARGLELAQAPAWYELLRGSFRGYVYQRLVVCGGQAGALALAFFLGDEQNLSTREEGLFRQAGLAHVLALSGSHLSLWIGFLAIAFRPLPFRWRGIVLPLLLTGLYCWTAGDLPALVRAWGALVLQVYRRSRGERSDPLGDLGLLVLVLGLLRPDYLGNFSFLLSLSAMAGLFIALKFPHPGAALVGPSLALGFWTGVGAFLGSLPLVCGVFGAVQPLGLVLSLPAGVLAAGFLGAAALHLVVPLPLDFCTKIALDLFYQGLMTLAGGGEICPPVCAPPWFGGGFTAVVGILLWIGYKRARGTTRQLRFAQRYQRPLEFPRVQHPQTLGTEFSHQPRGAGEDHRTAELGTPRTGLGDRPGVGSHDLRNAGDGSPGDGL